MALQGPIGAINQIRDAGPVYREEAFKEVLPMLHNDYLSC
mgnify:CR=1 FL=1